MELRSNLREHQDRRTKALPLDEGVAANPSWLRIIIVKKDRMAAEFIRHTADTTGAVAESICVQTAEAGLSTMRCRAVHLGIFGLTFSDMDGLDLVSNVRAERLAFRLLVVSSRNDETVRWHTRPGHVDGFFNSETDDWSLLGKVIVTVALGGTYFSPKAPNPSPAGEKPPATHVLSTHELKIFALLGDGCDDKQAGSFLGLSQHTVHGHRRRIMSKLGVQTRTELMRAAIQRGVVRLTCERTFRPGHQAAFAP